MAEIILWSQKDSTCMVLILSLLLATWLIKGKCLTIQNGACSDSQLYSNKIVKYSKVISRLRLHVHYQLMEYGYATEGTMYTLYEVLRIFSLHFLSILISCFVLVWYSLQLHTLHHCYHQMLLLLNTLTAGGKLTISCNVCVCVYVCVCVCVCVCARVHVCVCACMHMYMHTCNIID